MDTYLASVLIVIFASTLQAATGFGFSILAVPLLFLIHEPLAAIQINLILSVVMSMLMVPRLRADIDKPLLMRLIKGSVLGGPVGAAALFYIDVLMLKSIVGIMTIALTLLLLMRLRMQRTRLRDYATGSMAGIFTAATGLAGIPLLLYFAGTDTPKATVRSTVLAFFAFVYALSLGIQMAIGATDTKTWFISLALVPVTLLGIYVGQRLFSRLSQKFFQILIYAVLVGTGTYLLCDSFLTP